MKIEELKPGQKFRFEMDKDIECLFIGVSPCGVRAAWWEKGGNRWHAQWHYINCCDGVLVDEEGENNEN